MAAASPLKPPIPGVPTFASARGRARVATLLLWAAVAANVVIAVLHGVGVALDTSAIGATSEAVARDRIDLRDTLTARVGVWLYWVTLVPAAIAFIVWQHRAHANLEAVAPAQHRHSSAWAIFGWIVPIMNAFRPKQMLNDVWRGGSGQYDPPAWLLAWWLLWLGSGIFGRILSRGGELETLEAVRTYDILSAIQALLVAAAGVLAVRVVARLTRLQDEREASGAPPPRRTDPSRPREGEPPEGFTITPGWAPVNKDG